MADASPATPASASAASTPRGSALKRVRKHCSFRDCAKVDAGGGFCVGHGGGKKCSFPGCEKGYQTGGFCRKHGGGARCQVAGCGKVDAGKGLCRGHGGGKRCQSENCHKADVGGGFCTAHGGGRRCTETGCTKIDQGGGKCRAHGGAKRCCHANCAQTARGASGLCPDHGGAKICSVVNCRRLARGNNGTLCTTCAKERGSDSTGSTRAAASTNSIPKNTPRARRPAPATSPSSARDAVMKSSPTSPTSSEEGYSSSNSDSDNRSSSAGGILTSPISLAPKVRATYTPRAQSPFQSVASAAHEFSSAMSTALEDGSPTKCDGSHVASCLENGCSRSYGGGCNCALDCRCNQSESMTTTSVGMTTGVLAHIPAPEQVATFSLKRYILQIQQTERWLGIESILALISVASSDIRSVHNVSEYPSSATSTATERAISATERDDQSETPHLISVRCDRAVDLLAALASLQKLNVNWILLEQSEIRWARKEVVLRVSEMMCSGNCGNSVVNAIRMVRNVETANLVFELRQVVVRGAMCPDELSDAVNAIGFEPHVDAVTPLPNRFRFRVNELVDVVFVGKKLERFLNQIDGVESVVINVELAEVLVVAMLEDASSLLQAAIRHGFLMVEVPEHPVASGCHYHHHHHSDASDHQGAMLLNPLGSQSMEDDEGRHVCDIKVCPQNGCEQYRATVAHTAALAIGWSVPGCAMTWGGECTCGEKCKCKGCPTHNPAS
ncbi:hypothetical protein Gpo141_00010932 [Globisporangium polare]